MDTQNLLIALILYGIFEAIFRIGVLIYLAGWRYASWKILEPHISMFFSPGYWLARNCKQLNPIRKKGISLKARLIANYNLWNLLLSTLVFIGVITTQHQGYTPFSITVSLIVWRSISRSLEIIIAFGSDITTPKNTSRLPDTTRIKLAILSYLEIFIFSASLYAVLSPFFQGASKSILASLYVGTLTNVSFTAEKLPIPHIVFLQIFATLSLVVLSIAGYLGKVKHRK